MFTSFLKGSFFRGCSTGPFLSSLNSKGEVLKYFPLKDGYKKSGSRLHFWGWRGGICLIKCLLMLMQSRPLNLLIRERPPPGFCSGPLKIQIFKICTFRSGTISLVVMSRIPSITCSCASFLREPCFLDHYTPPQANL